MTRKNKKKIRRGISWRSKELHKQALGLYKRGHLAEALAQLGAALREEENSERWNDWAAVQHALGATDYAETGFRRALELDRNNQEAATNLGGLLVARGRFIEAAPFLLIALNTTDVAQRKAIQDLIARISKPSISALPVKVSTEAPAAVSQKG
jgi:Flp pilus assembly protein TadD